MESLWVGDRDVSTAILLVFIRRCQVNCLRVDICSTVFKSDTTLRSHLVQPKDALEPTEQDGVLYKIPCECGKVYTRETGRAMQERIKEHGKDTQLEINVKKLLAVINATFAVAKRKPEKIRLTGIRTLTSAIPVQRSNQLSYQANWELVIKLVRNLPGKMKMKGFLFATA